MITPQEIDQISFGTQTFGGYSIQAVDEFLEPLTEDYITLYKENALLKSKMKFVVSKLEEYRKNEASMKDAIVNAQRTCDMMVKEAEAKCAQMLSEANDTATQNAKNTDALIAAENARVEEAKRAATQQIEQIQEQIRSCIQALDRIKASNAPAEPVKEEAAAPEAKPAPFDFDRTEAKTNPPTQTEVMADEISASLKALVGTAEEPAPKAEPKHPVGESTTSKFGNLKFGRNYESNT